MNDKIDIVYTWVDGNDPDWSAKKKTYFKDSSIFENDIADQAGDIRYVENNELKYSLRSIEKYAPWVNKIFIITDNQKPSWLKDHEQIKIIDHTEIIPAEYLPTFNSSVIEAHLHNIDELSEKFIYFNDDMFLGCPSKPSDFFKNDKPRVFTSSILKKKRKIKSNLTYNQLAIYKSREFIENHYNIQLGYGLKHGIRPMIKSRLKEVSDKFFYIYQGFLNDKFRLNPFSLIYLYEFNELAEKRGKRKYLRNIRNHNLLKFIPGFYHLSDKNLDYFLTNYKKLSPLVFCINEVETNLDEYAIFSHGPLRQKFKAEK